MQRSDTVKRDGIRITVWMAMLLLILFAGVSGIGVVPVAAAGRAAAGAAEKAVGDAGAEVPERAAVQAEQSYLAGNPEEVAAVLIFTNDVHVAFEENIGYDGLALYKKELEAQYDHVLLIDAGMLFNRCAFP